jgi:N-methylhydantoinase B
VPVELQEATCPYVVERVQLRQDSGGAGTHRGGLGVQKSYRLRQDCSVYIHFERTKCPPWGLEGGGEGRTGYVEIHGADGRVRTVLKEITKAQSGDRIDVHTAGGGGFGPPGGRSVEAIARDLQEAYVSPEAAIEAYGDRARRALQTD